MPSPDPESADWFSQHLQVHEPMLRAWLQARFPDLADIDYIVQEAYARLLAARGRGEIKSPKAFFFATARNLAYDHFRNRRAVRVELVGDFDDLSILDEDNGVAETVARNQEIELVTAAVQSLPNRCRRVLTLRNIYGLSHKEIAARLGISVRTVEAHAAIGIRRCTEYLARHRSP